MKKIVAASLAFMFIMTCVFSASASADTEVSQRMLVKNIYSSEFTSLGTIPAYAEDDYYYFIKDSANHKAFLGYISGDRATMPDDDFPVIQKGDRVAAYFFSADTFRNGYDTVMEFYNYIGIAYEGYLQLTFEMEHSVDSVYNFFLGGSTAKIRWKSDLAGLTAYFGPENITKRAVLGADGTYSVDVNIGKNGAYPLSFVNETDDRISANITYTIGGYDSSRSTVTAVLCFVAAAALIALMFISFKKPEWAIDTEDGEEGGTERKKGGGVTGKLKDIMGDMKDRLSGIFKRGGGAE